MTNNITLNQKLRLIGFRIGYPEKDIDLNTISALDYDLEETLVEAIYEATSDTRILGMLMMWIALHGSHILQEKFFKKLAHWEDVKGESPVSSLVIAIAAATGHLGWAKWLRTSVKKPIYPGNENTLKSSIAVKGENETLAKFGIKIPKGYLQSKPENVYSVQELVASNLQYRNRYKYGTNWRADVITAIECKVANPFQISKKLGCSYESAYRITKEYKIATGSAA